MKIDFIISSLVGGGAERVLVLLANNFISKGYDVSIITFSNPEDYQYDPKIKRIRLHEKKFKNHTLSNLYNLIKYYKRKKNRSSVIISFITHTNFLSIIVAKLFNIPIICSEHTNHLSKAERINRFTRNYFYKFSNHLTVLTDFDFQFYSKKNIKCSIMQNPCSFDVVPYPNPNPEKVILAVGNLNRYKGKGFDNLLELATPVLLKNKAWKIQFVGAGTNGINKLKEISNKLQISDQIEFLGFVSNISSIMYNSEIFILTSIYEGLPMGLIEASSQGMACISYDCVSGPSDIITHNVNGILVEDQNRLQMREKLSELISNNELRNTIKKNALKSLKDFDIEIIHKKYLKIFSEICNK